jgi:hypothetical protein
MKYRLFFLITVITISNHEIIEVHQACAALLAL